MRYLQITRPLTATEARHEPVAATFARAIALGLLPLALTLHAIGLASLELGYLDFLFNDAENRLGRGADFFAVYGAGDNFLDGTSVYAPQEEGASVPYAYAFRYLPSVGVSFGALANLVPPWPAYWSWVAFNELLLAVNVLLTWRFARSNVWGLLGISMWLVFSPYYLELFLGQFSFLMASLFFWLGLSLYSASRSGVFASWTASLLVKANSLLFLPLALRTGWLKLALGGVALIAVLNLPYFLVVQDSWQAWSGNFDFATSDSDPAPHAGNLGLASLLALMAQEEGTGTAAKLARLFGGLPWGFAVVAVSLVATFLADAGQKLCLLALWICSYFLVFDEVWEHHYVMLLPALVLLVLFEPRLRPYALAGFLFLALPTPYAAFQANEAQGVDFEFVDPQTFWSGLQVYVHHVSKVLPVLLVWGALGHTLARGRGGSVDENLRLRLRELCEAGTRLRLRTSRRLRAPL